MFRLPLPSVEKTDLADWLELYALVTPDKGVSDGDLERPLRRPGLLDQNDSSAVERRCLDVFGELERRRVAAHNGYPFVVEAGRLSRKSNWKEYPGYVFCLCLSYFRWKAKKGAKVDPWRMFESLSCVAAEQYIQGKSFPLGSRSENKLRSFRCAVDELCTQLQEGVGCKGHSSLRPQDDNVDLVVWRDFLDGRRSKLIMFGQCAAGKNWRNKSSEMDPDAFWGHWMKDGVVSPLIKSFYIPHIIADDEEWDYFGRYGGILFERCRIAHWTHQANAKVVADTRYSKWCKVAFPDLAKQNA